MGRKITPPGYHVVEKDDWLSKLAQWYGFAKWQTIWNNAKNKKLRDTRNPNLIYPGDRVWIPEVSSRTESAATGRKHRFKVNSKKDSISIILKDGDDKPRSAVPYVFNIAGNEVKKAATTSDGKVTTKIPRENDPADLSVDGHPVPLKIGELNPMDPTTKDKGISGIQARLNNLGLRAGSEDGIVGPRTQRAITIFQKLEKIEPDGKPSNELRKKLLEKHGV